MIASSPGRAEKLPAPVLAQLLSRRGIGGRSSRGGKGGGATAFPRSSPMFAAASSRRGGRRWGGVPGEEEEEPSSPKVTCIGQVHIRKKKKKNNKSSESVSKPVVNKGKRHRLWRPPRLRCGCRCLLLCNPFTRDDIKDGVGSGSQRRSIWRRCWAMQSVRSSYRRRRSEVLDPDLAGTLPSMAARDFASDRDREEEGDDKEESLEEMKTDTKVLVPSATTPPPKNALLLMRCRSATHNGSSSLATRFWVSPSPAEEGERQIEAKGGVGEEGFKEIPKLTNGSVRRDRDNMCCNGEDGEEEKRRSSSSSAPLMLMRCKSEPASRSGRLVVPKAAYCFRNAINASSSNDSRRKQFSPPR